MLYTLTMCRCDHATASATTAGDITCTAENTALAVSSFHHLHSGNSEKISKILGYSTHCSLDDVKQRKGSNWSSPLGPCRHAGFWMPTAESFGVRSGVFACSMTAVLTRATCILFGLSSRCCALNALQISLCYLQALCLARFCLFLLPYCPAFFPLGLGDMIAISFAICHRRRSKGAWGKDSIAASLSSLNLTGIDILFLTSLRWKQGVGHCSM